MSHESDIQRRYLNNPVTNRSDFRYIKHSFTYVPVHVPVLVRVSVHLLVRGPVVVRVYARLHVQVRALATWT
jgi:hypothetical protein